MIHRGRKRRRLNPNIVGRVVALLLGLRGSFQPREEELIAVYLFNKVAGKDDVSMVNIPDCDLYGNKNPWEIWQEFLEDSNCKSFSRDKNELYLFTTLKKKENFPSRFDRRVGLGAWRFEGVTHCIQYDPEKRTCCGGIQETQISNPNKHIVLCNIRKNGGTARVGTGEKKPMELKSAVAATEKKNGDENKKEILDLLNGRFPELVITMDEVLSYLDHDNSD
ncbi:hypothetical protein L6164_026439 [Bauhinia variegata]|uniref:Uncharacterized protein n=1 Tax=Bauhinia variegata TaxID=167791 RepID=A0ACB9LPR6_BAUVA|nr:hypothetical protein L6164_026439 [Bauhinia variegata]